MDNQTNENGVREVLLEALSEVAKVLCGTSQGE